MTICKQAQIGLYLLKDAILEVLYVARLNDNEWVRAVEIRKQLGFQKLHNGDLGDFPIRYILSLLEDKGKVEQLEYKGPWRITDSELQKRKNESKW